MNYKEGTEGKCVHCGTIHKYESFKHGFLHAATQCKVKTKQGCDIIWNPNGAIRDE